MRNRLDAADTISAPATAALLQTRIARISRPARGAEASVESFDISQTPARVGLPLAMGSDFHAKSGASSAHARNTRGWIYGPQQCLAYWPQSSLRPRV